MKLHLARALWVGLCVGSLGIAELAMAADPPPAASFELLVDGRSGLVLDAPGFELTGGNVAYTGSKTAGDGSWVVTWNITGDLDVVDNTTFLTGAVTIENKSTTSHNYQLSVSVPLKNKIETGTKFGGSLVLKLKTNADGGSLTCDNPRASVWGATIDGKVVANLFYSPFTMRATGSSSLTTTADFGTPIPSLAGPQIAKAIGATTNLTLTNGEKATLTSLFLVSPDDLTRQDPPESCVADINGDGSVKADDLGLLLSKWGESGEDSAGWNADLNGDSIVDAADLGVLLGYWGQCLEGVGN